jgi:peroxiredoxin
MPRMLRALALCLACWLPASGWAAGEVAPDFTLRDVDGQAVSLSSYKGKVVLVNFWATWCAPCQVEMPHLEKMQQAFKDKGFVVLSISADDARTASMVKPLIKKNGYTFTVLLDNDTTVVAQYNPSKTLPFNVLIDQDGKIQQVHQGYNPGDEVGLRAEVEALLASTPGK